MYGLLVENLAVYIRTEFGEDKWEQIRRLAHVNQPTFSSHEIYPDSIIPRLAQKATKILGISEKDLYQNMGRIFVDFIGQYGYDRVLSILGRNLRDFLNGLDNLHEYLKFSYPRMKAPSFFVENETEFGLVLHYRSKRKGYTYYTMGQIQAVGRQLYNTDIEIYVVNEEVRIDTVHVTFQLHFENTAYLRSTKCSVLIDQPLPIQSQLLFQIFPFCIVFGSDMVIRHIGHSLRAILPNLVGKNITDIFNLARPLVEFSWPTVIRRTNNIFELVTVESLQRSRSDDRLSGTSSRGQLEQYKKILNVANETDSESSEDDCSPTLSLKGQMLYMEEWKSIIFLCTPMMQDLDSMFKAGLYLNDLSMHDFSRDLVLAGTQQSVELKLALDQEQQKSKRLEESMQKLDDEMKRTDELLYQMIPKAVADRLRRGTTAINTCETFDCVTILFSDVVTFTEICARLAPMEVVSLLNSMYSIFDQLTCRHKVYKVETIGDAYMVVSGAPEKRGNHAQKVCNMALDMMKSIQGLKDPSTGSSIQIRIGIHSGTVVAGVVGLKMPRYCLFGDTVNTASRMETTSEPMKIHISEFTRKLLEEDDYVISLRGTVAVKGKGNMKTYWLLQRTKNNFNSTDNIRCLEYESIPNSCDNNTSDARHSPSPEGRFSPGNRSLYSPVTFDEVAKHRQMSPIRQHANTWNGVLLKRRQTTSDINIEEMTEASPFFEKSCSYPDETSVRPFKAGHHLPKNHQPAERGQRSSIKTSPWDENNQRSKSSYPSNAVKSKPTAILFPCLQRNSNMPTSCPMLLLQNVKPTLTTDGRECSEESSSCSTAGGKKRENTRSNYCNIA